MITEFFKEWTIGEIWVVTMNGYPVDYAFSRSAAFKMAKRKRALEPSAFWSVTSTKATLRIGFSK